MPQRSDGTPVRQPPNSRPIRATRSFSRGAVKRRGTLRTTKHSRENFRCSSPRLLPRRNSRKTGRTSWPVSRILCTGCLAASRPAVIHLGLPSPAGSSGLPAGIGRATLDRLRSALVVSAPFGLAPGGVYRAVPVTRDAGGLLHHRFTLTSAPSISWGEAVCFLWHCPAGHPGLPLTTTLPCGVRTFLGGPVPGPDATARPARPHRSA
jgi:hypothetical protein